MRKSFLTIGKITAAAILLGSTSLYALEDQSSDSNGAVANGTAIQAKVVEAQNPYAADVANDYGIKRISEFEVNTALNDYQAVQNALLDKAVDLRFKSEEASSWSLNEKGLKELLKTKAALDKHIAAILAEAVEKDPKAEGIVKAALEQLKIPDVGALKDRIAVLEKRANIGSLEIFQVEKIPNEGFHVVNIGGYDMRCTTESFLNSTPEDESYLVCISANPGTIKTDAGQQTLHDVVIGAYHQGDTTISAFKWPAKFTNVDYILDFMNISNDPKASEAMRNAYQGLKYGGPHMNPKVYSTGATAAELKPVLSAAPQVKTSNTQPKPVPVVVTNSTANPVNVKAAK
jgi:hypothetical protein